MDPELVLQAAREAVALTFFLVTGWMYLRSRDWHFWAWLTLVNMIPVF